jgi:EpsI family protein
MSYEASFGLVILAISGYMLADGLKQLRHAGVLPRPSLFLGTTVFFAGNLFFLLGSVSGTQLVQQVSLIVTLIGLCWLFLGSRYMKELWVPLAYLVFALPVFGDLLLRFSLHLQNAAAWVAAACFVVTGMPFVRHGQILELPHITLEIARECNGVNHIVALMSLAVPLSYLSRASVFRKIFVTIFAFFLGIALNGIRVAMIGWWSVGHHGLHGPVSMLFVSFIFFAGFLILALLTYSSFGRKTGLAPPSGLEEPHRSLPSPSSRTAETDSGRRTSAFLLAAVLLMATWGMGHWYTPEPVVLAAELGTFPNVVDGWVGEDSRGALPLFKYYAPDRVIERTYRNGTGPGVTIYIGYFEEQRQGHEAVSFVIDRYHQQAVLVPISGTMDANRFSDRSKPPPRDMYFWYEINGRVFTNRYYAKLATAWSGLFLRRTNAAFVAILPELAGKDQGLTADQKQFMDAVVPLIRSFLRT